MQGGWSAWWLGAGWVEYRVARCRVGGVQGVWVQGVWVQVG